MTYTYRLVEGGMHDRFHKSRNKVQLIGGGYGNGKTACSVIKGLRLSVDYPGSSGLIARATYAKVNDTIRKEVYKWTPAKWIKKMPTKDNNTLYLNNGSEINFRYVSQRGSSNEQSTSNLLSATYDWIIVDQIEDPEFVHKDFLDLMGRLRGGTSYIGDDPTMPKLGPRWIILTCNPTRNWVYTELVKPVHDYLRGIDNVKLLCEVDEHGNRVLDENKKPRLMIDLFEGSTYENQDNVGADFIQGMMATYTNQTMRDRYILGKWGALDGLIYSQFDEAIHVLEHDEIVQYYYQLLASGYRPNILEGYDHGLRRPSCYGLFFVDDDNNVFLLDGFYEPEYAIEHAAERIKAIRDKYSIDQNGKIFADPSLFNRTPMSSKTVGESVARLFEIEGVRLQRGNNNPVTGIAKNNQYLAVQHGRENPITGANYSPRFFVSRDCTWFINEINNWAFELNSQGERTDKPINRDDHAMDMWKYAMTHIPKIASFAGKPNQPPSWMMWHTRDVSNSNNRRLPRNA